MSSGEPGGPTSCDRDISRIRLPSNVSGHARPDRHDEGPVHAALRWTMGFCSRSAGPAFPGEEVYSTLLRHENRGAATTLRGVGEHALGARAAALRRPWASRGAEHDQASVGVPRRHPRPRSSDLAATGRARSTSRTSCMTGVEPAALFRSDDGGRTFSGMRGLWEHPHRVQWQPGGGGMRLHTILVHPSDADRLLVAVSAGGCLPERGRWCDSWQASTSASSFRFMPDSPVPRVRPVRPQGRTRRRRPRAAVPAASRRDLPQRRRGRSHGRR